MFCSTLNTSYDRFGTFIITVTHVSTMRPNDAYDQKWYTDNEALLRSCFSHVFSGVGKLLLIMFSFPTIGQTLYYLRTTVISGFHFLPFTAIVLILGVFVYIFVSIWKIVPEYAELLSCFFVQPRRTA